MIAFTFRTMLRVLYCKAAVMAYNRSSWEWYVSETSQ